MGMGYVGKIMWVDLTSGKIWREDVADEIYEKYLSGVGLAAHLIYKNMPAGADPLGPDNILAFMSGLLTGTGSLLTGRWSVCGRSPLTGGWGDANCGGSLSPALKRAGVDGIFFKGISPEPVILVVDGPKAYLEPAGEIWGRDCVETEDLVGQRLGDTAGKFKIACIGPASEKLSLISGISNDKGRFAARSGLGAVMGSKKLKALAVKGAGKIPVHNKDAVKELTGVFNKGLQRGEFITNILSNRLLRVAGKITRISPPTRQPGDLWRLLLKKYGTSGVTALSAESGDSPVKNFSGSGVKDFPLTLASQISDDKLIAYEQKKYGCFSCPIKCGGFVTVPDGPYPLQESHKPEYETLAAFGTMCLVDDLKVIIKLNDMCNRSGLDTISAGVVVAFAIESFERGVITEKDTEGLVLKWGDPGPLVDLLQMIIDRRAVGDVLADGVKVASRKLGKGSAAWAVHAGGQELPMHDPRFDTVYATSYQCDPTPGRHTLAAGTWQDLMLIERYFPNVDKMPMLASKKAHNAPGHRMKTNVINTKFMQVVNGSGICIFGMCAGPRMPIFEWLNAATGWNKTADEYLEIGERIQVVRQLFNYREGIRPKDFRITDRAVGTPPVKTGPHSNLVLDQDERRNLFYSMMGWDPETGRPGDEVLSRLGLHL